MHLHAPRGAAAQGGSIVEEERDKNTGRKKGGDLYARMDAVCHDVYAFSGKQTHSMLRKMVLHIDPSIAAHAVGHSRKQRWMICDMIHDIDIYMMYIYDI